MAYEYKVVPAPTRGKKARGLKTPAERFAHALGEIMNDLAAEGWEYLRTDSLPAEERSGLTGRTTVFQNMLVFRRPAEAEAAAPEATGTLPEVVELRATPDEAEENHAPRLPAADKAQEAPPAAAPIFAGERRDLAAE